MRAVLVVVGGILVLVAAAIGWLKFDHRSPQAALPVPIQALGRTTPFDIDVQSGAPGLRQVTVRLLVAGAPFTVFDEQYPAVSWRGSRLSDKRVHVQPDLGQLQVPEGPATLEVLVNTYGWRVGFGPRAPALSMPVTVDLTPPKVEVLTPQLNARLGGVELAVFRQSPDTIDSGIQVDKYFFRAVTGYFADPALALGFFAIPQDLSADVRPRLIASDAAGNQREIALPCSIKPRKFGERPLAIDDDFLVRKVPEIQHDNGLPPAPDLLQGYLAINRDLRHQNEATIRELTAKSEPLPLWNGAFHRQSNAAPLSSFADRRIYTYKGEVIDHQTHLGFDLASLKLAPVEAEQNAVVVFAGNLGIYGTAVLLDHGLGIFSLYGHLSSVSVQKGEQVKIAQAIGQTGETGLAAGDHLHFSVLLQGVHVDPVEWWDPHWLKDHITPKLKMFPPAVAVAAPEPEAAPVAEPTPPRVHKAPRKHGQTRP